MGRGEAEWDGEGETESEGKTGKDKGTNKEGEEKGDAQRETEKQTAFLSRANRMKEDIAPGRRGEESRTVLVRGNEKDAGTNK